MAQNYFLYVRKSTDTEERQVLSIEAQIFELKQLAEKENLRIIHVYQEAMTAKQPGRPIFNKMLERIEAGEAQGIIAWHPDRLARNSVDGGRIIYLVDTKLICSLKFPTFWFENTPQGKFMLNIAFGQSKYYIDNLSENVRRGLRQKVRRGEWPSGYNPPGYFNDKNERKLKIHPVQGPLVKKLFEMYATGEHNLASLKKVSYEWGLVSRSNKPWVKAELQRTLKNTFYYGLMKYKGEFHEGIHEPLITKELFDQVQMVLLRKGKPNKYRKKYFPLLGLANCLSCGCSITAEIQKGHHYYRCTKKKDPCSERYVREEVLSEQIKEAIESVSLPSSYYQFMISEWSKEKQASSQSLTQVRDDIDAKLREVQIRLDRLLDVHLEGVITQAEYVSKKETLLNQKVEWTERLAKVNRGVSDWLEPCREFLEAAHNAGERVASENLESQKEFLKKIGSNFQLGARRLQFNLNQPWGLLVGGEKNANNFGGFTASNPRAPSEIPRESAAHRAADFLNPATITEMRRGRDSNSRYRYEPV